MFFTPFDIIVKNDMFLQEVTLLNLCIVNINICFHRLYHFVFVLFLNISDSTIEYL